ncbi:c-type cytochrome [Albirhodobacter sp. R86504]|uniref:c-type cytochrome n=1 Tax=Albirhodobacter sp. R86504 TaxID=3093848 RepID=UPI00366F9ABD
MPSGAQDYEAYCMSCHGDGVSAGEVATQAGFAPTQLAYLAKNNGGTFPKARVMSKTYGYEQHGTIAGASAGDMPSFAALMDGETIPYDSGDGIETPTPARLVQLAEYIEAMQR